MVRVLPLALWLALALPAPSPAESRPAAAQAPRRSAVLTVWRTDAVIVPGPVPDSWYHEYTLHWTNGSVTVIQTSEVPDRDPRIGWPAILDRAAAEARRTPGLFWRIDLTAKAGGL